MEMLDEKEPQLDERTNDDLDKLADDSDKATNRERPMTKEAVKPEPKKDDGFEFTHNGKPIKANREQIIKWAQMGYDRPQFAQKLNAEKAKWEQDRQNWEKSWGPYKQIDEYAKQNQDWWNFILQQWQTRGQGNPQASAPGAAQAHQGQPDPFAPKLQALEQKLVSKFEPVLSHFEQMKVREEDAKLEREIQSLREQHADLDWETRDENGKSLELRILEHAQAQNIPTFRAAMRDLLHDELLSRASNQAKISIAKGIQAKTKLGVLGETSTPTKGMPQKNRDMRKTSYEELENDIREELRAGRFTS